MALTVQKDGDITVAGFDNDRILDEMLIQNLGDELIGLTQSDDVQKLLLSFENVEFMSSAMIGKLVLVNKKCGAASKPLRFCCINDNLMEVFRLTNLDKVFKIDSDMAAAVAKFNG